jgi:hypothetical protein
MNLADVMAALAALGSAQTKKILLRHGAVEPFFGVKVGDLKPLAKQLKGQPALALELYATGNSDAQYLAGLIANGRTMTAAELTLWAETASWAMISGNTVAWVASEHPAGLDLALRWINAPRESVRRSGWATLGALAATVADADLDLTAFDAALDRVVAEMPAAPDDVRYAMNMFIISVGTYVASLGPRAITTARAVGRVEMDMGETACQVPAAEAYIIKSRRGAPVAAKRKTIRC